MERTWKPITAGILTIIASVLTGIIVLIIPFAVDIPHESIAVVGVVLGIVAIVGGCFALLRRVWQLALSGPILGLISPWPEQIALYIKYGQSYGVIKMFIFAIFLGIPIVMNILAIIFVGRSKKEFS